LVREGQPKTCIDRYCQPRRADSAAVADYRPEVVAAHKLKKDPTSGEGLVSFVAPLRERAGGPVVGVVIAGSFLDPRGDAKRAAEV